MKYIFVLVLLFSGLSGSVLKSKVLSVDMQNKTLKTALKKVNVGMSGFVVHHFTPTHSSIVGSVVVESFDAAKGIAILKISSFSDVQNDALPKGKYGVEVGDSVILAYAYSRALLVAPNEEVYYRITRNAKSVEWIHPDLFATILSFEGHPTPLQKDFIKMAQDASVGLFFFYLDQKLYTLDARSFKILNISDAPLEQKSVKLPFYTRIEEIDAAWWGEGSDELEEYEPHYYELMVHNNRKNKKLYEIIKNGDEKLHYLLDEFEIKE